MPLTIPGFSVGIGADADPLLRELRRVGDELEKTRRKTEQSAAQMSRGMSNVTAAASTLRTALGTLGVGFGVAAIQGFVTNTFRAADALKGAADAAGISAEALQRWRFAAEQSGSDAATMDLAIRTLNERLGDFVRTGTGPAAKALTDMGLAAKVQSGELSGTTETMAAVIEALAGIEDSTTRASLATDYFGKAAGPKMSGLLNEGVAGIRKLREETAVLTDEQVANADEIGDRWAKMTSQLTTNLQSATLSVTDWVTRGAEGNQQLADAYSQMATDAITSIRSTFPILDELVAKTASAATEIKEFFGVFANTDAARQALAELEVKRAATAEHALSIGERPESMFAVQEADRQIAALNEQIAAMDKLTKGHKPLEIEIYKVGEATALTTVELNKLIKSMEGETQSIAEVGQTFGRRAIQQRFDADRQAAQEQKTFNEAKAREEYQSLSDIAVDFTKRSNQQRHDATIKATMFQFDQMEDITEKFHDRYMKIQTENQNELGEEMKGVWQGVGQSIQSTFADTYEDIFTGGVTSFQDFADSIKDIFIRLAAEVAAMMTAKALFGQLSGADFSGLFGAFGAAGGAGAAMGPTGGMTAAGQMRGAFSAGGMFIPTLQGGAGIGASGQAAGFTSPGGMFIPSLGATGGGGVFGSGVSGAGVAGYGLAGGMVGSMLGPALFGQGPGTQIGGGLGGAAGAAGGAIIGGILLPGVGAPLGALAGGLLGGAAGGGIGSLFGGGGSKQRSATIGGGPLGGTGSGLAGQFGAEIDQQLQQALTTAQEAQVNAVLRTSKAIKLTFDKEKGLSEGDKARISAARLGPSAMALGITNVGAVTAGTAEQQMGQFQEALTAKKAIDDLRDSLTPFATQTENLREQMDEAWNTAAKYGISLDGVIEAQARAYEALDRQQRAQYITTAQSVGAWDDMGAAMGLLQVQMEQAKADADALGISTANLGARHAKLAAELERQQRSQFITVAQSVGAMTPLNAALELLNVQMQQNAASAIAMGVPLDNIAATHRAAAQALIEQHQAQEQAQQEQARAQQEQARAQRQEQARQRIQLAEAVGATTPLNAALNLLNLQMQETAANAQALNIPLKNLSRIHLDAAYALIRQQGQETIRIAEAVGAASPLSAALASLNLTMQDNYDAARRLGVPLTNLRAQHLKLAQALNDEYEATQRQLRAQIDLTALEITNPFEQLLEPLRALGIELDRSLMDPLEQFNASAQNFRDVAQAAMGGSTTAIAQLDEAARGFISTAETVGASPGRARAVQEVQAVLGPLQNQITSAQAQASRGVEGAIWGANQRVVDTLGELVTVGRQQIEEMRRLQRQLS